jgi:Flp pilus assembly protein TadD
LGVALYQLGKWRQAAEALREAVARLPDQPAPYVNLGSALWQSGDARGAEAAYAAGLKAAPDSPELNYNLGMLRLGSGRDREGRLLLEKAGRLAEPAP